jgi:hypothetical protein
MKPWMPWSALALLGSLGLSGCYVFEGGTKDGQSHWMTACESSADCAGNRLCACGVCTVECSDDSATCGSNGRCEAVDERSACDGAPRGVDRVCLERCAQDLSCEANALVCEDSACVPRAASGPGSEDAGVALDGSLDSSLSDDETGGAGAGNTSMPGDEPAMQPEDAGKADDAGMQEPPAMVHACNDPPFEACAEPGASCGFCEVGCNGEICVLPTRPACAAGGTCPDGLICHIDYTCIERGVPDEEDIATLAMGPLEGYENFIASTLVNFVLAGDTLYWLDVGNHNSAPGYDPSRNGGIYRVDLVSRSETAIAIGIDIARHDLFVQQDFVFYADRDFLRYFALDSSAVVSAVAPEQLDVQWLIEDAVIFYGEDDGTSLRRHDPKTGDDRVLIDLGAQHRIKTVSSDGARIFIEEAFGTEPPRLISVDKAGGPLEVVAPSFESGADRSSAILYDGAGRFVLDNADNDSLLRYAPGDAEPTVLVAAETTVRLGSLFEGYAYYALLWSGPTPRPTLMRVPIDGGTPEVLRRSNRSIGAPVLARNGFIYWAEDRRVLRMPIP